MMWLDSLKIAILNKDTQKVLNLIESLPKFDNIDDLICAKELIGEFIQNLKSEQNALSQAMRKIEQTKCFLED